jgi:hypothetical protein
MEGLADYQRIISKSEKIVRFLVVARGKTPTSLI